MARRIAYEEVLTEDPGFRKLLAVESLVAEASELIVKLMAEQCLSKAGLARRLGKSRAWVTQLLSGEANMTIRTLAELTRALGSDVKLSAKLSVPALARDPAAKRAASPKQDF